MLEDCCTVFLCCPGGEIEMIQRSKDTAKKREW